MVYVEENTFAAACIDQNSLQELCKALEDGPDERDLREWGLTDNEWLEQVELSIKVLKIGYYEIARKKNYPGARWEAA